MNNRNHILVLEENTRGKDYIIGDVHGSKNALEKLFNSLREGDRLFIVGDLIDRGNDSTGVLKLITDNPEKVYSIRGNHEAMFLEYSKYRNLKEKNDKIDDNIRNSALNYVNRNGGMWANDLNLQAVNDIAEQFYSLPYIIHVKGENPFHIAHADMPLSDDDLMERIENKQGLNDEEINYIIWARPKERNTGVNIVEKEHKRKPDSTTLYCGHNPYDGVRKETNSINLDVGTNAHGYFLVANHTDSSNYFLKGNIAEEEPSIRLQNMAYVQEKLKRHQYKRVFIKSTAQAIDQYICNQIDSTLSTKAKKDQYLSILNIMIGDGNGTDEKKHGLSDFLSKKSGHLLKMERYSPMFRSSPETKSMSTAMKMLKSSFDQRPHDDNKKSMEPR